MQKILKRIAIMSLTLGVFHSCDNVDEGLRINYPESSAQLTIEAVGLNRGAIGDTIQYIVQAASNSEIKALSITTSVSGAGGTGYLIPDGGTDPFVDHTYGTIQPNTSDIDVYYNYIINQDTVESTLTFKMVDDEGAISNVQKVRPVPDIVAYKNVEMHTFNSNKTDGFSTIDGLTYHVLPNYEPVTVVNQLIQESIDIIFIVHNETGMLVAPYDGWYQSTFIVRNKTKFRKIKSLDPADFESLTAASLSYVIDADTVKNGGTIISGIQVNDIIGFQTDFASANSYNYGLLKIREIHPTNSPYYEGESYLLKMDVVTQK